jgi:hypothetical protein
MNTAAEISQFDVLQARFSLVDPDKSTLRETLPGQIYEPAVTTLLRELLAEEDACFLDVGALYGYFTCFAGKAAPHARVHAFEPAPHYFETLQANAERNALDAGLHRVALSDENGSMTFKGKTLLSDANRSNGLRGLFALLGAAARAAWSRVSARGDARDGLALTELVARGRGELLSWIKENVKHALGLLGPEEGLRTVPTVRYDDYRRAQGIRATIAKIDVHGAEGMVLAGMHDALRDEIRHVLLEVHTAEMLVKYDHRSILEFLRSAGFRVYELLDYRSETRAKRVELVGDAYERFVDPRRWTLKENLMMRMLYATRAGGSEAKAS